MNPRRLGILIALALLVGAAAFWLNRAPATRRDTAVGRVVLPGLAAELDAITAIHLVGSGATPLVTLEREQGLWQVREASYPADAQRVRRLLVALGELKVVESKTADPARYAALGVEDPSTAEAKSVRLELTGAKSPAALIVGRAAGTQGVFVRLAGQDTAFEARPGIDLARTPHDWLARGFLDLAAARIAAVRVERADGPAWSAERPERGAAHFTVPSLPHGAELTNLGAADSSASAFGNLEFEEVRGAIAAPAGEEKRHRVTVECYDGLVVTLSATAAGTEHWLTLSARADAAIAARHAKGAPPDAPTAGQVAKDAAAIEAMTAGHEYRIPPYRFDAIFRPRQELLRH